MRPLYSSSGNGEPDAKRTVPLDHSTASWNSHSDSRTGFESGKRIGRGFSADMVSMTDWLNALCVTRPRTRPRPRQTSVHKVSERARTDRRTLMVERPRSAVGWTYLMISVRSLSGGPV